MKNVILLLALLTLPFTGFLSAQDYNVVAFSEPYADLENPTSVNNGLTWDDPQFTVPIGFDFTLFGETTNELTFDTDDGFLLSNSVTYDGIAFIVSGLDMVDKGYDFDGDEGEPGSLSPISYTLSGPAGDQIFKLEWKNVGFYEDGSENDGVTTDFANYQMWLYESENVIEFRYGESSYDSLVSIYEGYGVQLISFFGAGVLNDGDLTNDFFFIEGANSDVTLSDLNNYEDFLDPTSVPDGTVYRIGDMVSSNQDINQPSNYIKISPNPTSDIIQIESNISDSELLSVSIMEVSGKLVKGFDNLNNINISDLPAATYFLQVKTTGGILNERVVKF